MRPAWLVFPALVAALVAPLPASARDPVAAEALFDEARAASAQGDHARACAKLAESQRLDPAPGTLLNLADCKEKLGLVATAWQLFREAADLFDRGGAAPRAAFARKRAAALEPRLAQLAITLADAPVGTRVARDGVELGEGSLGAALPLDPGAHVVVVTAPGRAEARFELQVAEGETRSLRVAPGAAVEGASTPAAGSSGFGAPRAIGVALLGLSAGAIAAGAVTGVMTIDRKSLVEASCRDKLCAPAGVDAAAEGRTLSAVSTATFVGGAVGLAVGMYLTITGPRWAGAPRVSVRPGAGPSGASLALGGVF